MGLEPEASESGTGAIDFGLEVHKALAGGVVSHPEALALAERFWSGALGQRALRAQRVEREFDFIIEVDGVLVSGQMDLWFEEGGEMVVVDYKTDRSTASFDSYSAQLRLYAHALEKYAGRKAGRAFLYYLRLDQSLEVSLLNEEVASATTLVSALKLSQQTQEFAMNPGQQCLRCKFYRGDCPAPLLPE